MFFPNNCKDTVMSHPLDSYVFWNTEDAEADEFRQLYDKFVAAGVEGKELNKLLSFVCQQAYLESAFDHAGEDQ
jgi:hypothetical protein